MLLRHAACTDLTAALSEGAVLKTAAPAQRRRANSTPSSHARQRNGSRSGHTLKQTDDSTRFKGGGGDKGYDSRPGTTSTDGETADADGAEEPSGTDFLDEIKRRVMGAGLSRTASSAASSLGARPEQVLALARASVAPRALPRAVSSTADEGPLPWMPVCDHTMDSSRAVVYAGTDASARAGPYCRAA